MMGRCHLKGVNYLNSCLFLCILAVWFVIYAGAVTADVEFIQDVTHGPKRSPAAAIIGRVSAEKDVGTPVRMRDAVVDLYIGNPYGKQDGMVSVHGKAVFKMENMANDDIRAIVAFPLGDRSYGSYRYRSFTVHQNGKKAPVFAGSGGYKMPWRVEPVDTEAADQPPKLPLNEKKIYASMWRGLPVAGDTLMQSLFWEAQFPANELLEIVVDYVIDVPQQLPTMVTSRQQGTRNARLLKEDSISREMSKALNPERTYLFFSYIITSGASWQGTIGSEQVRIHLEPDWQQNPVLYMRTHSGEVRAVVPQAWQAEPDGKGRVAVIFMQDDFEPNRDADFYFALETLPVASIGVATLELDGTLVLMLRAEGDDGTTGDAEIRYPPDHPKYTEMIKHLGGIRFGDRKPVPPW